MGYSCVMLLAAIAYTNAKAAPDAKAQVPYSAGPVSAPLVVNPAKPYSFAYEVIDPAGGNAYGHRESSDGAVVEGEYRVVLPDTRTQIVTYSVSAATGYVAEVRYEGPPVFGGVAPVSERLTQARPSQAQPQRTGRAQQQGRPNGITKRIDENSDDFEAAIALETS